MATAEALALDTHAVLAWPDPERESVHIHYKPSDTRPDTHTLPSRLSSQQSEHSCQNSGSSSTTPVMLRQRRTERRRGVDAELTLLDAPSAPDWAFAGWTYIPRIVCLFSFSLFSGTHFIYPGICLMLLLPFPFFLPSPALQARPTVVSHQLS